MINLRSKSFWSVIAVIAVPLFLIIFKPFSWSELFDNLQKFDRTTILIAAGLTFIQYTVMGLRVHFLVHHPISMVQSIYANLYGQCLNNFLPARSGDVAKAMLLAPPGTPASHGLAESAGTLLSDRVVDISAFIVLILLTGSNQFLSPQLLPKVLIGLAVAAIILFLLLKFTKLKNWSYWQSIIKGLKQLSNPRALTLSSLTAIACWICEGFTLMTYARGLGFPLTFSQSFLVVTILNLGIAIPISVGNIGPFEAAIVYGLGLLGVPNGLGLAIATLHHIVQMLVVATATFGLSLTRKFFHLKKPVNPQR